MHREKEHLGVPYRLELREPLRQHAPLTLDEGVHARRRQADRASQQLALGGLVQDATGEIDHLDLMLAGASPQRGHDLGCARERDGALRRRAPREHRDPHQRMPAS